MKDIDAEALRKPSPESRQHLDDAFSALEPYAGMDYTRATEVNLTTDDEPGSLRLVVSQNIDYGYQNGRLAFYDSDENGTDNLWLEAGNPESLSAQTKQALRPKVIAAARDIGGQEGEWLLQAWGAVTNAAERQVYDKAAELLDNCPFPYIENTHHSLYDGDLPGGGSVQLDWYTGLNQTNKDNWPAEFPVRRARIRFADQEIEYLESIDGEEYLNVKDPRQEAERQVTETGPITIDSDGPLSMEIHGNEEFMRYIHASLQEIRENQALGIAKPTQEKVEALATALDKVRRLLAQKPAS